MKQRIVTLSVLLMVAVGALAGCNTVKGMGQDIQKAGEVLEDAATKKK